MITRIHVNSQNIRKNPQNKPVFVATANGKQRHGHLVHIEGPSTLIYARDNPLPGEYEAEAWIETAAQVWVYLQQPDGKLEEVT